jgi:hypothetical protein
MVFLLVVFVEERGFDLFESPRLNWHARLRFVADAAPTGFDPLVIDAVVPAAEVAVRVETARIVWSAHDPSSISQAGSSPLGSHPASSQSEHSSGLFMSSDTVS